MVRSLVAKRRVEGPACFAIPRDSLLRRGSEADAERVRRSCGLPGESSTSRSAHPGRPKKNLDAEIKGRIAIESDKGSFDDVAMHRALAALDEATNLTDRLSFVSQHENRLLNGITQEITQALEVVLR
jgi:hypothetical protein